MNSLKSCSSEVFKDDINQLCNKCPLIDLIDNGITNQILKEAYFKKEIMTNEQFKNYINSEIENSSKAITKTSLNQKNQKTIDPKNRYLKTRIKNIIWNKERIKALNSILLEKGRHIEKPLINKYDRVFKNDYSYILFTELINNAKTKNDYSFIFRVMVKDELIYEDIKHIEYINILSKDFDVNIEKILTLGNCETSKKHDLYQLLKDTINKTNPK
jgi:hypothetical protein